MSPSCHAFTNTVGSITFFFLLYIKTSQETKCPNTLVNTLDDMPHHSIPLNTLLLHKTLYSRLLSLQLIVDLLVSEEPQHWCLIWFHAMPDHYLLFLIYHGYFNFLYTMLQLLHFKILFNHFSKIRHYISKSI